MESINNSNNFRNDEKSFTITQLSASYQAFGAVMHFLSEMPPFLAFEIGILADVVRTQLRHGQHLAAMAGDTMVGYAGWLRTSADEAAAWVDGRAILTARFDERTDAAALTIFAVAYPAVTARLIRGARSLNPGVEVFFKRDTEIKYPISRKASVLNFMPKQPAIDGGI